MEKQLTIRGPKRFSTAKAAFENADFALLSEIASSGADITLLLSADGQIRDVAYLDQSLERYNLDEWQGKALADVVTGECVEKVALMLEEASKSGYSRPHQVNHAGPDKLDLPTEFVVAKFDGFEYLVAFGRDLRRFSKIQQQLINAQFELEREYRRIRENEARFRLVYQKLREAVLVVDSESLTITDANKAVADIMSVNQAKLSGSAVASLFDKSERVGLVERLRSAAEKGRIEQCHVSAGDASHHYQLHIEPFRESGKVNLLVGITTNSKEAEAVAGNPGISGWMDNVPEPMVRINDESVVVDLNDRFLDLVRVLNRNQIIGRAIGTWVGSSNVDMQVLTSRLKHEGEVSQFLTTVRDDAGVNRNVRISATRGNSGASELTSLLFHEQTVRDTRVTVSGSGATSEETDFAELIGRVPLKTLVREAGDVIEKLCIVAALQQTGDNKASAADLLGLSRQSLYMKLKRHGLD